ncbi:MAG: TRAP transporter small permease subunit [Granulosicoccus sp.]|nr:TRAP transporter small permease subunit [Granulosicoccus sp.]
MSTRYYHLCHLLHRLTLGICQALVLLLLLLQVSVVILRYCFGVGFLELQDLTAYVFASLVTLSIPVALVLERHVRVDVWRERQTRSQQSLCDRFAVWLLLVPVFLLSLYLVYPDIAYAWRIREGSRESGGLAGVYLVKTLFPLSCVLMILQGVASILPHRPAG